MKNYRCLFPIILPLLYQPVENVRAEELTSPRLLEVQRELAAQRDAARNAMNELQWEREKRQECLQVAQQATPQPLPQLDIALLKRANESLAIALRVLGAETDVGSAQLDLALYENSMSLARQIVALCDGHRCQGVAEDE